jgi:hypothetical protein
VAAWRPGRQDVIPYEAHRQGRDEQRLRARQTARRDESGNQISRALGELMVRPAWEVRRVARFYGARPR